MKTYRIQSQPLQSMPQKTWSPARKTQSLSMCGLRLNTSSLISPVPLTSMCRMNLSETWSLHLIREGLYRALHKKSGRRQIQPRPGDNAKPRLQTPVQSGRRLCRMEGCRIAANQTTRLAAQFGTAVAFAGSTSGRYASAGFARNLLSIPDSNVLAASIRHVGDNCTHDYILLGTQAP